MILISECRALGEGAITIYFEHLRFDMAGTSGTRTHNLPDIKRKERGEYFTGFGFMSHWGKAKMR
jgi:hypothetical protein